MSAKPDAWLYEDFGQLFFPHGRNPNAELARGAIPLYRRSPTHKEEQAVVRAAVNWATSKTPATEAVWSHRVGDAVDRLLAKRKKAKR